MKKCHHVLILSVSALAGILAKSTAQANVILLCDDGNPFPEARRAGLSLFCMRFRGMIRVEDERGFPAKEAGGKDDDPEKEVPPPWVRRVDRQGPAPAPAPEFDPASSCWPWPV
jgi:hypothetical protein